ncbi:hypothetical protein DY000_02049956 [Brassica cretica]|uniref:Uncharacterized protein n=1 Tax=Brassica cretica TaxID=69181 RepID=A0ABQ7EWY1_BRACR|nr:hypothetical protein DY000_02049956 [Brassica cretica]
MPSVLGQSASCNISYARFNEGWTEHTVQLGGWPSWIDHATSSAIRAGSNTRPARPSAELDQSCLADGRAGSNTRPARPSTMLDQSSSANGRAGMIVLSHSCPRSSLLWDRIEHALVSSRSESPSEL